MGLVTKSGDNATNGNDALDNIMTKLNAAYSQNNEGKEFSIIYFNDNDEIDKFVKSSQYES